MKKLMMAGVAWVAMGSGVALAEPGQVCTSIAGAAQSPAWFLLLGALALAFRRSRAAR